MLYGNVRTRCEKHSSKCQRGTQWSQALAQGRTKTTTTQLSPSTDRRNLPRAPAMRTEWQESFVEITEGTSCQRCLDIHHVSVDSHRPAAFPSVVVPASPPSLSFLLPHLPMWPSPRLPWPPSSNVRGGGGPGIQGICAGAGSCASVQKSGCRVSTNVKAIGISTKAPSMFGSVRITPLMEESFLVQSGCEVS